MAMVDIDGKGPSVHNPSPFYGEDSLSSPIGEPGAQWEPAVVPLVVVPLIAPWILRFVCPFFLNVMEMFESKLGCIEDDSLSLFITVAFQSTYFTSDCGSADSSADRAGGA